MRGYFILLSALVWAGASANATGGDKVLRGTASIEMFECDRSTTGLHCKSAGESLGTQPFIIPSDYAQGRMLNFPLSEQKMVRVKIASASSPNSYFITTGVQGLDSASNKPIFATGDAVFEVDNKRNAQSVQLYSPTFDQYGSPRVLKATLVFRN